jgi:L-rhamnose mutarotase
MRNHIIYIILTVSCLAACNSKGDAGKQTSTSVKRFGSVTGIRQDKIPYYKQLHANAWPGVLKKIGECNIRNYSIYLQKIDTGYYLFSYFEYTGSDFEQDMKKMAADTTTQRWWKETDPAQLPLPEAKTKKQVWTEMEEVFHSN